MYTFFSLRCFDNKPISFQNLNQTGYLLSYLAKRQKSAQQT